MLEVMSFAFPRPLRWMSGVRGGAAPKVGDLTVSQPRAGESTQASSGKSSSDFASMRDYVTF
jgi:hypothetical protein